MLMIAISAAACTQPSMGDIVTLSPSQQDGDDNDARLNELLASQAGRLTYNGEILAVDRIAVIAEANGMAMSVDINVGQEVEAGDILIQIDTTTLEAQREQAMANLDAAKARLELQLEGPTDEELEAADAGLAAAEEAYNRLLSGPDPDDLQIARAQLRQSEAVVRLAQSAYNEVKSSPRIGSLPQSLELERATLQLESAQAQYNKATKGPTASEIASAYSQVVTARTTFARMQDGPKPAERRITEAQIRQAETGLFLAQLALDKATVRAPVDGIVTTVDASVGSMIGQGSPVVVLLSHEVKVTIPVEEYKLSTLEVGQAAVIRVDAYPDQLFDGTVTAIAPELDAVTRTVQVTISPTNAEPNLLRPGMFASVDLK